LNSIYTTPPIFDIFTLSQLENIVKDKFTVDRAVVSCPFQEKRTYEKLCLFEE